MFLASEYGIGQLIPIIGLLAFIVIIITLIIQRVRAKESEKPEDQNDLID